MLDDSLATVPANVSVAQEKVGPQVPNLHHTLVVHSHGSWTTGCEHQALGCLGTQALHGHDQHAKTPQW